MPRVLIVVEREAGGSSSAWVSGLQYCDLLRQQAGYTVDTVARRPSAISDRVFRYGRRLRMRPPVDWVEARMLERQEDRIVEQAAEYDLVYDVKIPSIRFRRALARLPRTRVLMCFTDAMWLPHHRRVGWQHLEEMLAKAHGVACVNDFTATWAKKHNPHVYIVPDCPQIEAFDRRRAEGIVPRQPDPLVLGWMGSPFTAGYLYAIWEPLEAIFARHPHLHLRILGADHTRFPPFERVRYSVRPTYDQAAMVEEVLGMDIGLFPLFPSEDAMARGAHKAQIYMAGETVPICQRLGDARSVITEKENGLLASTTEEWLAKLEWLIGHPKERAEMAARGLAYVRERLTLQKCFSALHHAMEELLT